MPYVVMDNETGHVLGRFDSIMEALTSLDEDDHDWALVWMGASPTENHLVHVWDPHSGGWLECPGQTCPIC